jgi:hypothetical protein
MNDESGTHILLTPDLRQFEPLAFYVPSPSDWAEDHVILHYRVSAEKAAREFADDEQTGSWPIYPLYAGSRIDVF